MQKQKQHSSWREPLVSIALLLTGAAAFVAIDKWVAPTSFPVVIPEVTVSSKN